MSYLSVIYVCAVLLTFVYSSPISYEHVRGTPYKVSYDHRAIKINDVRTMLISGAIHYPRSTPAMWPYIMRMAKTQGLNTLQTYVFWSLHEHEQGVLNFNDRANLSRFLQEATNAGLFVNLRVGPYICGEWTYGGLPVWLNQIPNMVIRSNNDAWKATMKKFVLEIMNYVSPYLAKNGGPIILAQIENEYVQNDMDYVNWCGSLVSNELSSTEIPWIMCNGHSANTTIETCNSCNCLDDGWIDQHRKNFPDQPLMFTENEGGGQRWGNALGRRIASDIAYSVAEWFAAGGAYHSYYMWYGGSNYERSGSLRITTMYQDDACLHSDGTPNEPKYTQLSRLQHLIANHAEIMLSQDANRIVIPYWNGTAWVTAGTQQFAYSYPPSVHFIINQHNTTINVLFNNQNISLSSRSVRIFDNNMILLWDSANYSDINHNTTELVPIVTGPLAWKIWSEPSVSDLPVIVSAKPLEQYIVTNDDTIYLWYRRNITLTQVSTRTPITVDTRHGNSLVFFLNNTYLGTIDDDYDARGPSTINTTFNLTNYQINQEYLFEILSISLGSNTGWGVSTFDYKGIVGNVSINGEVLSFDETHSWVHQKGLVGEYYQIYTEQGSSKVNWDSQWTKGINQSITWFQTRFDLDHLAKQDTIVNPVLLDAQGLNRGHAFVNGHDIGLYWLIVGVCHPTVPCCCHQEEINCNEPTQRYYHIPSDWLMAKNNLLTIFDDSGAPTPDTVRLVQRIVIV